MLQYILILSIVSMCSYGKEARQLKKLPTVPAYLYKAEKQQLTNSKRNFLVGKPLVQDANKLPTVPAYLYKAEKKRLTNSKRNFLVGKPLVQDAIKANRS
nr:uncharacterized protein LOC124819228 isoform X4 [Hydra vulgaris]